MHLYSMIFLHLSTNILQYDCLPNRNAHGGNLFIIYSNASNIFGNDVFNVFVKYVKVFDLYFLATKESPDNKLLHGASILLQYIDNNSNGIPDNLHVYDTLVREKSLMLMFKNYQNKIESGWIVNGTMREIEGYIYQDLEACETGPEFSGGRTASLEAHRVDGGCNKTNDFDAALEECFHFLSSGYNLTYPEIFGYYRGSNLSMSCDQARGGYFPKIPKKYPSNSWYRYYDETCDYACITAEYVYWAMSTMLGAQKYRCSDIKNEWNLCTKEQLLMKDPEIYKLLNNLKYSLPKQLPRYYDDRIQTF